MKHNQYSGSLNVIYLMDLFLKCPENIHVVYL